MRANYLQGIVMGMLTGLLLGFSLRPVAGHGDVHLQIKTLTQEILKTPTDSGLYLRRSELYRQHRLWDPALADLEKARARSPEKEKFDFAFGRLYLDAGWPESALSVLDRFVKRQPRQSEAHLLRGRALVQLDKPLDAVAAYTQAIATANRLRPEHFIERSRAQAAAGPDHVETALAGLDEGMKSMGPLVTLQLPAIELELKRKAYDAALKRLDAIAAQSPRKESWLKRRGEILMTAGRQAEAMDAFREALAALNKLPPARRFVPAMRELEEALVSYLESKPTPPKQP